MKISKTVTGSKKKVSKKNIKAKAKNKLRTTNISNVTSKSPRKYFDYLSGNVLYTLIASIFMIAGFAMVMVQQTPQTTYVPAEFDVLAYYSDKLSKLPVLQSDENTPIVSAQSVYAIDLNSGITLYEKNPEKQLFPASTTKILTALVALDYFGLSQEIEVGNVSVAGQKMGLARGERITVEDLLYGLLVFSGNDAAEVLARSYEGGRSEFISDMNLLAKNLGLSNSYFTNPSGLDDSAQVTTAKDLAILSRHAMRNPTFAKIVATEEKTVEGSNGIGRHKLTNINELVGSVEGVVGVKTGWTEVARENLVTYVERDAKPIIIVVLGSQDRFTETEGLIEWIYTNYEWKDLSEIYSEGVSVDTL